MELHSQKTELDVFAEVMERTSRYFYKFNTGANVSLFTILFLVETYLLCNQYF